MRFGRHLRAGATVGAGLYALAGALAAVTWIVVRGSKVGQAVVVARHDVVDDVRPRPAAEVADVAVGLEDQGADLPVPPPGEAGGPLGASPPAAGHDVTSSLLGWGPIGPADALMVGRLADVERDLFLVMEGFMAVAADEHQPAEDVTLDQVLDAVRRNWPAPDPLDPRGDGLCPECPTDLDKGEGWSRCIECGWSAGEPPSTPVADAAPAESSADAAPWFQPCECGDPMFKHLLNGAATACRECKCPGFRAAAALRREAAA